MSNTQTNLFGFVSDKDESLLSKGASRVFGLNQGVTVSAVEFRERDQQDKVNPSLNIEFEDNTGGKFFYTLYGDFIAYDRNGNEITDKTSKEYQAKFEDHVKQMSAVITHFGTKVLTEEDLQAKWKAANIKNVPELLMFAEKVFNLYLSNKVPVDMFLHYQWTIKKDKDVTFLEVPANMKNGAFLAKDTTGTKWTPIRDEKEGLKYKNDLGEFHVFQRDASFMKSPRAQQQKKEQSQNIAAATSAMNQGTTDNSWI